MITYVSIWWKSNTTNPVSSFPPYIWNACHIWPYKKLIKNTFYSIRSIYWPLDWRHVIQKLTQQHTSSFLIKVQVVNHIIESLPTERATHSWAFFEVGLGYYCPFYIKEKNITQINQNTVYKVIFVFLNTKAVFLKCRIFCRCW